MSDNCPTVCPCDSGQRYAKCCGLWHSGPKALQAPTAQALMRSRYSAFVLDRLDYLLDTWHSSTRPAMLSPNPPALKWLGLNVKRHQQFDPTHAEVEFVARHRLDGKAHRMHEVSRFVFENGRWFYVDGDIA